MSFVLPPHVKMIDHGVVAGDRASHLTSLPYCMAVAAVAPDLAFDVQQSPPTCRRWCARSWRKSRSRRIEACFPTIRDVWPARVTVVAGTDRHERLVSHVPGDPARAFDRARVREKFLRFVAPVIGTEKAERILVRCGDVLVDGRFELLMEDIGAICRVRSLAT